MNAYLIDAIAKAILYEGYMLYPYRPSSVKNRQRFNFGVLYPHSYAESQAGSDAWNMQTECLVEGGASEIEVKVRFLKLIARTTFGSETPASEQPASPEFASTSLPWQEAFECEVSVPPVKLNALTDTALEHPFVFPAKEETESLRDANGRAVGLIERRQEAVLGSVELRATRLAEQLFKLQVRVINLAPPAKSDPNQSTRDSALMQSLVSAHIVLGVTDGQFVSLLEPPDAMKDAAATCQNVGAWPVLVGAVGERSTLLASPIILYDYPQIAPESPGDLFDGTEIDEILALRIMTMTDGEKAEMRNTDDRARQILERTESLPVEHLARLHGTLRDLHSMKEEVP
jgi:hydrogenase maturation protease